MTKMRNRGKSLTKRAKLNLKIKKYKSLNKKVNKYKPISFELSNFATYDEPLVGTPLERKRAQRRNYRRRMREMNLMLDKRIEEIEEMQSIEGPVYLADFEPLLQFTLKDEQEINTLGGIVPFELDLNIFE